MTLGPNGARHDDGGARLPAAGLWRRCMGMTYEAIILFGVLFFFAYAFSALLRFQGHPGMLRDLFQWFLVVLLGTYFTWFWSLGRRTLPMKAVDLLITDRHDRPVSTLRALLRFLLAALMVLAAIGLAARLHPAWISAAILPLAWCLIDADGQSLYDRLAGTRLVVSPARKRSSDASPPTPLARQDHPDSAQRTDQRRTQSTK